MEKNGKQRRTWGKTLVGGVIAATVLTLFAAPRLAFPEPAIYVVSFLVFTCTLGVFAGLSAVLGSGRMIRTVLLAFFCLVLPVFLLGVFVGMPVLGAVVAIVTGALVTAIFLPQHDRAQWKEATLAPSTKNDEPDQGGVI